MAVTDTGKPASPHGHGSPHGAAAAKPADVKKRPLDLQGGTPFQQQVWQALLRIAPGTTASYGSLSAAINATDTRSEPAVMRSDRSGSVWK